MKFTCLIIILFASLKLLGQEYFKPMLIPEGFEINSFEMDRPIGYDFLHKESIREIEVTQFESPCFNFGDSISCNDPTKIKFINQFFDLKGNTTEYILREEDTSRFSGYGDRVLARWGYENSLCHKTLNNGKLEEFYFKNKVELTIKYDSIYRPVEQHQPGYKGGSRIKWNYSNSKLVKSQHFYRNEIVKSKHYSYSDSTMTITTKYLEKDPSIGYDSSEVFIQYMVNGNPKYAYRKNYRSNNIHTWEVFYEYSKRAIKVTYNYPTHEHSSYHKKYLFFKHSRTGLLKEFYVKDSFENIVYRERYKYKKYFKTKANTM